MTRTTCTTQSYSDKTQPSWTTQVSKSLMLAASSIGIGWVIGYLWRGSESLKQTSLEDRTAPIDYPLAKQPLLLAPDHSVLKQINHVYQGAIESTLPCSVGLLAGGAASLLSSNPLPLFIGASPCLPLAQAESVIPDSTYDAQRNRDLGVNSFAMYFKVLTAAGAAALPLFCGPGAPLCLVLTTLGGAAGAAGVNEGIDYLKNSISKDDYLEGIAEGYRDLQKKISLDPNFARDPILGDLYLGTHYLQQFSDERITEYGAQFKVAEIVLQNHQTTLGRMKRGLDTLSKTLKDMDQKYGEQNGNQQKETTLIKEQVRILNEKIDNSLKDMTTVNARLSRLERGTQFNAQKIQDLKKLVELASKSTNEVINHQIKLGNNIKNLEKEASTLTSILVQQAMMISTKGFESDRKIMTLERDMEELFKSGKLTEAMAKSTELKKAIQTEKETRAEFEANLIGIAEGFKLVSLIVKFGGQHKEANAINTVGRAAVSVIGAIKKLRNATPGPKNLTEMATIAGALFSIVSLFMDSPDSMDVVLKSLENLRVMLKELKKEMHERFNLLEWKLESLQGYMDIRFNHLLEVMLKFHRQIIDHFTDLKKDIEGIKDLANKIRQEIGAFEIKVAEAFAHQHTQSYRDKKLTALIHHQLTPNPMPIEKQADYFETFYTWAIQNVADPRVTHSAGERLEKIAEMVMKMGIDLNIQSLADLATKEPLNHPASSPTLPNPALWVDAVETFLDFLWLTPEFKLTSSHELIFTSIRNTGARFQNFVLSLQNSPQFYQNLINEYREKLEKVQKNIRQLVINRVNEKTRIDQGNQFTDQLMRAVANNITFYIQSHFQHKPLFYIERHLLDVDKIYNVIYSAISDNLKIKDLDSFTKNKIFKLSFLFILEYIKIEHEELQQWFKNPKEYIQKNPISVLNQSNRLYELAREVFAENLKLEKESVFNEATMQKIIRSVYPENLREESIKIKDNALKLAEELRNNFPNSAIMTLSEISDIVNSKREFDYVFSNYIHSAADIIHRELLGNAPKKFTEDFKYIRGLMDALKQQYYNLEFVKANVGRTLSDLKKEYLVYEFDDSLNDLNSNIAKRTMDYQSKETTDLIAHRHFKALSQIYPRARQVEDIEKRLYSALKDPSKPDETNLFLLHHLSQSERDDIYATLKLELDNSTSELVKALEQFEAHHVLLEAYLRIGFNHDFYNNFEFRMLFENTWSRNAIKNSILTWNTTIAEEMPYIQIADKAIPYLEELQRGIFEKMNDLALARNDSVEPSKQRTGYDSVDEAQLKLYLYEALFLPKPNVTSVAG